MEQQRGGLEVTHLRDGKSRAQVHSCGFMVNVSDSHVPTFLETNKVVGGSVAGAGKSVLWYVVLGYKLDGSLPSFSSSIIEDIREMHESRQASLAFFYCDFRDDQKKDLRGLLSSLLAQLCHQSDAYWAILSDFYLAYDNGFKHASDSELIQCIKTMVEFQNQAPTYIIIDGVDECSTSTGMPSPRDNVLGFVKELVRLQAPNLRICVTSRPEADIEPTLGPLAFCSVSLHDDTGQGQDITEYIKFVVNSDPKMRTWREAERELVINVLIKKADGM